jgi:hypothetical protein
MKFANSNPKKIGKTLKNMMRDNEFLIEATNSGDWKI